MLRFSLLGSGSRGNSLYVESGSTAILLDAGFSGKEIVTRLRSLDRELSRLSALCLTHEHGDHIHGVGVLSRRGRLPVHANAGTFAAGEARLGKLHARREFVTGEQFAIGGLQLRSFAISHDTADPVGFVIDDGHYRLGYCTDTGKVSHLMARRLAGCDALILEFNHNLEMLKNGPYPPALQQRVRSSHGHLSNEDAADFLAQLVCDRLRLVVLAHLSETNNTPQLAALAARRAVAGWQGRWLVAGQEQATPLLSL
jgi:phosphoribosyl 1,2-cyclic phosphodiesterase